MKSRPAADHFHPRHGDPRHPGDGLDHPGFAKTDSRFSRRRHDRSRPKWSARFAVVFALMQFFFSPLLGVLSDRFGQPPDHSALKSRSRFGLHRDGDGAHFELAFSRPSHFRNHYFKHSDRDGLHRRRYAKRKTSWSVRPDRRGFRSRIHVRTSDWWIGSAMSIRVSRFGLQPASVWRIGSGVTFSFRNPWRKISEKNSSCGVRTRSARSSCCVLITNFGG